MSLSPFCLSRQALTWRRKGEMVHVCSWGRDGARVRAGRGPEAAWDARDWALLPARPVPCGVRTIPGGGAELVNGRLRVVCSTEGRLSFYRKGEPRAFLEEENNPRRYRSSAVGMAGSLEQRFQAREDERLYGLGQHAHGFLDQKGCVIPLEQRNTEVAVPFLVSNLKYGVLWNHPGVGQVELGRNGTTWSARSATHADYWVSTASRMSGVLARYADATGHALDFPRFAEGFWQCKLRYRTQEELLAVARGYRERGLPLSVIVVDYFHWTAMGDWKFDPQDWPDPSGMVRELRSMGVELMVSVWPTVNPRSANFPEMERRGLLVAAEQGVGALTHFIDAGQDGRVYLHHYDATHPEARAFLWSRIRENYHQHGIRLFWLDACEPELNPFDHANIRYHAGNGDAVGCVYPREHARTFAEGLSAVGEKHVLTLCRSAWAGSQRWGAAVWSGDIPSTFESLRRQVRAGLNMGLSGIPWWTTDIGGFHGGDPDDPGFRELVVRWFQYGVFCPIFRLHGVRHPATHTSGGPNELWSFGAGAYPILEGCLRLRESLRPYLRRQMALAKRTGLPMMRPVFLDYEDDVEAWEAEGQFLFGPDVLVAPVTSPGAKKWRVYLPAAAQWLEARTERSMKPGWHDVDTPLEIIPIFIRKESGLAGLFRSATRANKRKNG